MKRIRLSLRVLPANIEVMVASLLLRSEEQLQSVRASLRLSAAVEKCGRGFSSLECVMKEREIELEKREEEYREFGTGSGRIIPGKIPWQEQKPQVSQTPVLGRRKVGKDCTASYLKQQLEQGRFKEALNELDRQSIRADVPTYACLLRCCGNARALSEGKWVHDHMISSGYGKDRFLGNLLVEMYGKCGVVDDARAVFDSIRQRNVFSWSIMIVAYARCGHNKRALQLFRQMYQEHVKPDTIIFGSILGACIGPAALTDGKVIHASIVASGYESDVVLENSLVNMYGKCGSVEDAKNIFDRMRLRDVVSWNAMIAAYGQNGDINIIFELLRQMQLEGVAPDSITFVSVLSACARVASLTEGRMIHARIVANRYESDVLLGNSLVNMYGKCGSLQDARNVFERMPQRNVVSWTAMIAAYSQNGHAREALEQFWQMQQEGLKPDSITFLCILDVCTSLVALTEGSLVHTSIVASGFESDIVLGTALVNMYGKCGRLEDARSVLDKLHRWDAISCNAMIAAYCQNGHGKEAMELLRHMQREGVKPDSTTFVCILDACASMSALTEGKLIHDSILANGFESDVVLGNSLINMYGKCGSLEDAKNVFDKMDKQDVVSWNTLIGAYGQNGHGNTALELFGQMQQKHVKPDSITFISILSACSHAGLVDEGCEYFVSMGTDHGISSTAEHYGCMIDLLGRAGLLDEAENLISNMPFQPGAAEWGALLAACRIYSDLERGAHAAEHVFELESKNAAPYVLLSNIFAAVGKWEDVAKVRNVMDDRGAKKQPGCSWIKVNDKVHEFFVGDKLHPQLGQIYAELWRLCKQMKEAGYVPDTKAVLHDVEEKEKEEILYAHSERLAVVFGLIATPFGTPIHITKNLRVCSDCHTAIKFISRIVGRKITVRDANRFHHFEHGLCSCEDFW